MLLLTAPLLTKWIVAKLLRTLSGGESPYSKGFACDAGLESQRITDINVGKGSLKIKGSLAVFKRSKIAWYPFRQYIQPASSAEE
jgi:hypothetical protein